MISINQKKFVNSLKQKKYQKQEDCFVVEGVKLIEELLQSDYQIHSLYASSKWLENNSHEQAICITEKELSSISSLVTPNEVLAVVKCKTSQLSNLSGSLSIALDNIQDPGNLGTIIRVADWFGINNIICSEDTVDWHNPKVIQASMGSMFRVNVVYKDLAQFFSENKELIIYGALLQGDSSYHKKISSTGAVLLMGNESKGVSDELQPFITERISIPQFGEAESLNVAIATSILAYEIRRG